MNRTFLSCFAERILIALQASFVAYTLHDPSGPSHFVFAGILLSVLLAFIVVTSLEQIDD